MLLSGLLSEDSLSLEQFSRREEGDLRAFLIFLKHFSAHFWTLFKRKLGYGSYGNMF